MRKHLAILCLLLAVVSFAASWPTNFYLDGGGQWNKRVPIFFENIGNEDLAGRPVALNIDKNSPLIGQIAGTIRIVDELGRELKYAVEDKDGYIVTNELILRDFTLQVPLSCPAKGKTTYYVYFGNDKAWASPDKLETLTIQDFNGGFEKAANGLPAGWQTSSTDDTHKISISTDRPASGRNCLFVEADQNSQPTWFKCFPRLIPVQPGSICTITVKIKAEDVKGRAGWFVHVGNSANGMLVNHVEDAGEGTYDWKVLKINVTIPNDANTLHTGTALYGSGKVWYDDFEFTTNAKTSYKASFGAVETLNLREEGRSTSTEWYATKASWFGLGGMRIDYAYRIPVRIVNPNDTPLENAIICLDLPSICHDKSHKNAVLTFKGRPVKTTVIGSSLMFTASCPPKTAQVYYFYTKEKEPGEDRSADFQNIRGSDIPSDQIYIETPESSAVNQFAESFLGNGNLVRNPSFEKQKDGVPLDWECAGEKVKDNGLVFGTAHPGCFGSRHAYFTVPKDAPKDWSGWRQTVTVKPNKRYIYGAWVAYEGTDVPISVHGHLRDEGEGVKFLNVGNSTKHEHEWIPMFGFFTTSATDKTLQIHLTMNGHGTVRHDGVLIAESTEAIIEPMESRPMMEDDIAVWQVNPVVKTFREDLPPYLSKEGTPFFGELRRLRNSTELHTPFFVALAQNETEPLQLAIRAGRGVNNCRVSVGGLENIGVEASVGVIKYLPIDHNSSYFGSTDDDWFQLYPRNVGNCDGWAGWWPDPVTPVSQFNLIANRTQPLWISFKASEIARPGIHKIHVKITCGKEELFIPVILKIWNFALSKDASFPAVYDLRWNRQWNHPSLSAKEQRREILKLYKEKKICPNHVLADPIFTYDRETKTVTANFTEFDAEATWYFDEMKFPVAYTPGFFYLFGWAYPPKALFGEQPFEGEFPWAKGEPRGTLRPDYVHLYQQCLRLFMDHCREKNWDDRFVLYISDEPHFDNQYVIDQVKAICNMIKEVEPKLPIYSSTWKHCKDWDGYLSLWGAGHWGCFPEDEMKERIKQGDKFWFTTDGQMCTDTPYCAIERLLPHYCFKYGAEAYEFWGATWLTFDPWEYGWHAYIKQTSAPHIKPSWTRYPNGDGYLMYPGTFDSAFKPVTSIRLEAARDGVEDYEFLQMVKRYYLARENSRRSNEARSLLQEAEKLIGMPSAGGRFSTKILPDPDSLYLLRMQMGDFLEK
ncbi:MAG: DUF4091 domain-containing protein [Victivallales bacterium]|nr:DUF4091 domain-containing protein [Victivallales bacterium]